MNLFDLYCTLAGGSPFQLCMREEGEDQTCLGFKTLPHLHVCLLFDYFVHLQYSRFSCFRHFYIAAPSSHDAGKAPLPLLAPGPTHQSAWNPTVFIGRRWKTLEDVVEDVRTLRTEWWKT